MKVNIKKSMLIEAVKNVLKEAQYPSNLDLRPSTKDIFADIKKKPITSQTEVDYSQYANGATIRSMPLETIREKTKQALGFYPTVQQILGAIDAADVTRQIVKQIAWDRKQGYFKKQGIVKRQTQLK